MKDVKTLQDKWKPRKNTGKTRFNRNKAHGESWTELRKKEWGADYTCTETWVR